MELSIDRLPERIRAALLGAAAAESTVGTAAGVRQMLDLAAVLGDSGGRLEAAAMTAAGLDAMPGGGPAALLLRAVPIGLLTPLDRPRFRQAAHRSTTLAGADEGTAMTAVATAVLAADLTRFDLETALIRLRQTLLEEAPSALHLRLKPLSWSESPAGGEDPGSALQLAITALDRAEDVPAVISEVLAYGGDAPVACALAAALAGARTGLDGCDPAWAATVPGRERIDELAATLAAYAETAPPQRTALTTPSVAARLRAADQPPAQD